VSLGSDEESAAAWSGSQRRVDGKRGHGHGGGGGGGKGGHPGVRSHRVRVDERGRLGRRRWGRHLTLETAPVPSNLNMEGCELAM
jgi:hypothetical protein